MPSFKQRGGAHIGWVSASWPLAGIEVDSERLVVTSLGRYVFSPEDVTAIEEVGALPVISQGIRVHHTRPEYPERVVFHTLTGRAALLAALRRAGFRVGRPAFSRSRGTPIRVAALIAIVGLWNLCFLLEAPWRQAVWTPGIYVLGALGGLFALATLLPVSKRLQALVLHEDRQIGEISSLVRLVQLVSGVMLLAFGLIHFAR